MRHVGFKHMPLIVQRALQIADDAMRAQLATACLAGDGPDGVELYPCDGEQRRVCRVAQAAPAIVDAFSYLQARALVSLRRDYIGDVIVVRKDVDFSAEG